MMDTAAESTDRMPALGSQESDVEVWCHHGANEAGHRAAMEMPPDAGCLADARRFVERALDRTRLDDRSRYLLLVAVHEAVVNAIQHGSASGEYVRVTSCRDDRGLSFTVSDRGSGFVLRPSTSPDLQGRGRGLTLMFHAVDEISQHLLPDGKEIRMTKWLPQGHG